MERNSKKNRFTGKKFDPVKKFGVKKKRSQIEDEELQSLQTKLEELKTSDLEAFAKLVTKFEDFPLSSKTKKGLQDAKFAEPTEIQRCAILPGILGYDVLGGAKTGSGKTLAFLIPILEKLYKERWSRRDGLGALIISPTRELALQTFKVLKIIGKYHDFSADLVIGGKFLKEERARINQTNIVICTPGRLKQHLETTVNFRADNLHVLVLDEADRILDLGFQRQMTEIAENLPQDRQTLLFSATQTRVVRDLARISMRGRPVLAFTNDLRGLATPTPKTLQQSYIVCQLSEKVDILWSFVKNHLKSKIIIFFSTCKQVRFVYEVFRRMRPGITVLALHSKMKYMKRLSMCEMFGRKQHAVLFATDIAARGLDFPVVKWVIQADCPVDVKTYIHRSGRTARCDKDGDTMLFLLPSEEEEMVRLLKEKNLSVEKKKVDSKKRASIQKKMASLCAVDVSLKEFAQRAFVAYLKFVVMASNKKVFDVAALELDQFACSLGLAFPPIVKFVTKRKEEQAAKHAAVISAASKATKQSVSSDDDDDDSEDESSDDDSSSGSELSDDEMQKTNVKSAVNDKSALDEEADDRDDDFLLKKTTSLINDEEKVCYLEDETLDLNDKNSAKMKKTDSKFAVAKKILKKQLKVNTKVVFDDDGLPVDDKYRELHTSISARLDSGKPIGDNADTPTNGSGGIDINAARLRLREQDKVDKQRYREMIKLKHKEKRLKLKAEQRRKRQRDGQQDEDEEEGSDEPDLSFLPDPDKVYGPARDSSSDEDDLQQQQQSLSDGGSSDEEEDESSEDDESSARTVTKKRKLSVQDEDNRHCNKVRTKKSRPDSDSEESSSEDANDSDDVGESEEGNSDKDADSTGLSLVDDEAIALKLLQS